MCLLQLHLAKKIRFLKTNYHILPLFSFDDNVFLRTVKWQTKTGKQMSINDLREQDVRTCSCIPSKTTLRCNWSNIRHYWPVLTDPSNQSSRDYDWTSTLRGINVYVYTISLITIVSIEHQRCNLLWRRFFSRSLIDFENRTIVFISRWSA